MATKKAPAKKSPSKTAAKKTSARKTPAKPPSKRAGSPAQRGPGPQGRTHRRGRKFYNEQTGGNLKPGVKGATDTPEKKRRKGSFLTRHFTTPPGQSSRMASRPARRCRPAAWGEPVPKTEAAEKKLAAKGRKLLDEAKQ